MNLSIFNYFTCSWNLFSLEKFTNTSISALIKSDHRTWYNLSSAWAVWAFWGSTKTMLSIASTHSCLIDMLSFGFFQLSVSCLYTPYLDCRFRELMACDVQVTAPWQVGVSGRTDIWVARGRPRCVRSSPGARWRMTGGYSAKPGGRADWLIGSTLLWGNWFIYQEGRIPLNFNFTLMCRMKDNFYNWIQFQIHMEDRKKLQMK